MTRRVALASLLGIAGIVVVFYPELARLQGSAETVKGAVFTMLSVLVASLGSIVRVPQPSGPGCRCGKGWRGACSTAR